MNLLRRTHSRITTSRETEVNKVAEEVAIYRMEDTGEMGIAETSRDSITTTKITRISTHKTSDRTPTRINHHPALAAIIVPTLIILPRIVR